LLDFWAFRLSLIASSISLIALAFDEIAALTADPISAEDDSIACVEGSGFVFLAVVEQPTTNIHINKGKYLTSIR
jgi:hypothetical protein